FLAEGRKDDILLRWRTEDETDNAGFYVERSLSGNGNWTELGFVLAGADYSFSDQTAQPHIDYYYRLRQTDRDGRVSYSEVRTARIGEAASSAILLYPNPTGGRLQYRLLGGDQQPFALYDAGGRQLLSGQLSGTSGSIDLTTFPAGIYFLRTYGRAYRIARH
ncbi:MAG: T9SS type A sorting domain-containing protein, partial [Bacteroidota bacterium]